MKDADAEHDRAQEISKIRHENELILQKLAELEKHHQPSKPVSESEEEEPTNLLASILRNAEDQAAMQTLSQKKKLILIAERLEEAHRLGIYNEPINTICRFLCLTYHSVKANSIRKALPAKYKEPQQSRIAQRQAKGLAASVYRHHKKRAELGRTQQVSEHDFPEGFAISSVTPYKDSAHHGHTFASWLRHCRKKKYNTRIFEKIKKDKAFCYICMDLEFALWYLEEVYHPSRKELSTVRKAMEVFKYKKEQ